VAEAARLVVPGHAVWSRYGGSDRPWLPVVAHAQAETGSAVFIKIIQARCVRVCMVIQAEPARGRGQPHRRVHGYARVRVRFRVGLCMAQRTGVWMSVSVGCH
jgi:hypothetical protein